MYGIALTLCDSAFYPENKNSRLIQEFKVKELFWPQMNANRRR